MSVDREVRKCGAIRGVKQLRAACYIGKHIAPGYVAALVPAAPDFGTASVPEGSAPSGGGGELSFKRDFLHSLRAILIGSMPTCFHHPRSSPTR